MRALSVLLCAAAITVAANSAAGAAQNGAGALSVAITVTVQSTDTAGWTSFWQTAAPILAVGLVLALFNYLLNKDIHKREHRRRSTDYYCGNLQNSAFAFWQSRDETALSQLISDAEYLKKYSAACGKHDAVRKKLDSITTSLRSVAHPQTTASAIYAQVVEDITHIRQILAQ